MNDNFKKGDHVFVKSLRQKGQIIKETKAGHYLIQLSSMQANCKIGDLQYHSGSKSKDKPSKAVAPVKLSTGSSKGTKSIDLHAMRVEPALELVEKTINELIMKGIEHLEIIHGIGSGRIKEAVVHYLANSEVVVEFNQKPLNPGAVLVRLRTRKVPRSF